MTILTKYASSLLTSAKIEVFTYIFSPWKHTKRSHINVPLLTGFHMTFKTLLSKKACIAMFALIF